MLGLAALAAVGGSPALAAPAARSASASASAHLSAPFPASSVTFEGHGLGPGYGMGQWGAFGYAAHYHWTAGGILLHYYSDKANPVTVATLSTSADSQTVRVSIEENNGHPVEVTSESAFTIIDGQGKTAATIPKGQASRAVDNGRTGAWLLQTAPACGRASWKTVASGLHDPVVVPASSASNAPMSELLTLCRGDGARVTYRGRIEAYDYTGGGAHWERTVNEVPLEEYVADVTPSESPSSWAALGGTRGAPNGQPWGFQELKAQAVAVRSYVLYSISSGGWNGGFASICDNYCQTYSSGIVNETPISVLAAKDTIGEYLVQAGSPAPTEYASSSGGYTETLTYWNGKPIFAAALDKGDAVCIGGQNTIGCNPWHTWTVSVPVSSIEATYPTIGTLMSVKVTQTDPSGRVTMLQLTGSSSSASVSGSTFVGEFGGFLSTLFQVTNGPGATTSPPAVRRLRWHAGTPGAQSPVGLPPYR